MARMLPYKRFIAPYELTRYSTGSYHLEEMMSDPYSWTSVMSRKTRNVTKVNNKNQWLDQFLRTGNGIAHNIFQLLDVITLAELRCTSRIFDKFVLRYCQTNPVHGTERGIYDVAHFLFLFPHVNEISLPNGKMNTDLLTPNMFVGRKLHTLRLRNCNFTDMKINPESFRGLDMVSFYNCTIPDETPERNFFSCMESVRLLSLECVTGLITGANCFRYLPNLKSLNIGCKVNRTLTDDCWEVIANTCPLVELFAGCSEEITDVAIECVTRNGLLQRLDVNRCMSPLFTRASQPFLKRVPELCTEGCMLDITLENCDVCGRSRRIDMIAHHLEHECNMQCQLCQETIMITHEQPHLMYKCNNNYIQCEDCGCMYLGRKRMRHRRLCAMKLITCDLCPDNEPFHKKDYKKHLAKHGNYNKHCTVLTQKIKALRTDTQAVRRDINQLMADAAEEEFVLYEEAYPEKHREFIYQMRATVAKHAKNEHKKLLVEYNLQKQYMFMQKYLRTRIERNLQSARDEREDEEEEEANNRYWDDYDEYERRPRWSDYD
jgi:hypothetical protein